MTTTATVPDVEVDESELTQQPCEVAYTGTGRRCEKPAVGEDLTSCYCGHVNSGPMCSQHIGCQNEVDPTRGYRCRACLIDGHVHYRWLIHSRYYTRRAR